MWETVVVSGYGRERHAGLLTNPTQKMDIPVTLSNQIVVVQSMDQLTTSKKKMIEDLTTWLQAFSILIAIISSAEESSKEEITGLVAHSHLVIQLAKDLKGPQWLKYDREYRLWAAAKRIKIWGELQMSIYGRCLASHSSAAGSHTSRG